MMLWQCNGTDDTVDCNYNVQRFLRLKKNDQEEDEQAEENCLSILTCSYIAFSTIYFIDAHYIHSPLFSIGHWNTLLALFSIEKTLIRSSKAWNDWQSNWMCEMKADRFLLNLILNEAVPLFGSGRTLRCNYGYETILILVRRQMVP